MLIDKFPFTEDMAQASLEGRKTATSRTKRYGKVGDTFYIEDVLFEITDVSQHLLEWIATMRYEREGFLSPQAFRYKWEKLHPHKGFVPEQRVWFHEYRFQSSPAP